MDKSQSKSLSLNLDLPDLFVKLTHLPVSNFTSSRQKFRDFDLKSYTEFTSQTEMNHFLSMGDAKDEVTISKKNSNVFRSMMNTFGSFVNVISKLPNYMTTINNPLSVTVVPNGGIISSEYILKNLTRKKEHLSTCMDSSTNILQCVKNKTWMESVFDTNNDDLEQFNLSNFISKSRMAIMKSINLTNKIEHCNKIDDMHNPQSITCDIGKFNNSLCPKINMSQITTEHFSQVDDNNLSDEMESLIECDEFLNSKESMNRFFPKRTKNSNVTARTCSIGRGKVQLRKSGISQLKNRKNKSKHDIYSNIQGDIDVWENEEGNFSEISSEDCVDFTSTSTIDNNFNHDKTIDGFQIINSDYPSLICTSSQLNQSKSLKIIENKNLESPLQSPKHDISINFGSPHSSDSSFDSEDSFSIVFQDKSESECNTDYDSESPCTESESDESEESDDFNHKVRFTFKPTIHKMIKWDFAYRAARKGPWEQAARDRERFNNRINFVGKILDPILLASHRQQIYKNRLMDKTA
ncbi:hypothetical protein PV327_004912 [Microctonus hyperodae]|uniref:Protein phosphatase 1 regulatory subunit 15A/B C-terminal domain-containing protein n=1 Tax=Microctonus hyperodae TaxID=165561 RepID=A0AA39FDI5_MICHY|nr:hypothetical protein PV327_004912 [Microctonus hyperodae]